MMLSLSHKLMLMLVDKINVGYNELPIAWRKDLLPSIQIVTEAVVIENIIHFLFVGFIAPCHCGIQLIQLIFE